MSTTETADPTLWGMVSRYNLALHNHDYPAQVGILQALVRFPDWPMNTATLRAIIGLEGAYSAAMLAASAAGDGGEPGGTEPGTVPVSPAPPEAQA